MTKRCSACRREYWSRWRNELPLDNPPPPLCDECRAIANPCPYCGAMRTPPADPDQLNLFPAHLPWRRRRPSPDLGMFYVEHSHKASQATKRKQPYH